MFVVCRVVAGRPWEIVAECFTRAEAEWELSVLAERQPRATFAIDTVRRAHR